MSALNGTIFSTYSEHAKPDTNALIIISPHKGLLSQLAAQQRRISSPPVFHEPAVLFSLCLMVSVKLRMFMLPMITEDYYIVSRLREMTDKIENKKGGRKE